MITKRKLKYRVIELEEENQVLRKELYKKPIYIEDVKMQEDLEASREAIKYLQQRIDKALCCLKSTDVNVFDYMIIEDAIDILQGDE